jgi:hypothetical protein
VNPPSLPGFAPGGVGFSADGSSAQALTLPAGVSVGSGDNGNGTGKGSQPTSPASGVAGNVGVAGSATDLSGPSGFDWRLVVGLGSVAILLLGLLVLVMPRRMPRRSGR